MKMTLKQFCLFPKCTLEAKTLFSAIFASEVCTMALAVISFLTIVSYMITTNQTEQIDIGSSVSLIYSSVAVISSFWAFLCLHWLRKYEFHRKLLGIYEVWRMVFFVVSLVLFIFQGVFGEASAEKNGKRWPQETRADSITLKHTILLYSAMQTLVALGLVLLLKFGKRNLIGHSEDAEGSPRVWCHDVSDGVWVLNWSEPRLQTLKYTDLPPDYESCIAVQDLDCQSETPPPSYGSAVWGLKSPRDP